MTKTQRLAPRRPRLLRHLAQVMGALVLLTLFAAFTPAKAQDNPLEAAVNAVVVLRSADAKDRFLGSGFVWAKGLVVTNAHVVGKAETLRLIDAQGGEHQGEVIARDPVRDVAVIATTLDVAPLPHGPAPGLGLDVWAIGAPLGLDLTVTRGVVSARTRQVEAAVPLRLVQHDAALNPGSSGGPLVTAEGALLGMNSRIADGSRYYIGMSYAIATADLVRIVDGLIAETLPAFPKLGLQLRPVSREIAAALGMEPTGVLIDRVMPGELAEKSGLQAGDIILTAGQTPLHEPGALAFAIDAALGIGRLPLGVLRNGQPLVLELVLTAPQDGVLALRGVEGAAPLNRVTSYRLEGLGVQVDDSARITAVTENSPGLFAGLVRGDVILAVNGHALAAADLRKLDITDPALILVQRAGGMTLHVILDPWDSGEGIRPVGGANVLDPAIVVF
ncbi:S1C family serine protease [Pseudorhodobacter sp. E13]|uniref:S1C family serine protease n=1 Tax=Pseudorhodobacter sp. E13 TaxID=2487931 RepID=UPI001315A222|nr:trypsin-like peptidase domain-containing protein [Pseudorhodobacter sp. E13]